MRLLLDTHIFIWAILNDPRLSAANLATFESPEHELLLSASSLWEIVTKNQLGKLPLPEPAVPFLQEELNNNDISLLDIAAKHIYRLAELPRYHRDPFDRLLVAQSLAENIPIMTQDAMIRQYPVRCFH